MDIVNLPNKRNIRDIFTDDLIAHYKRNKSEITTELLDNIRTYGNEGKQVALEILDTEIDDDYYYLDAFDNRISYNGDRQLKKAYTKMLLADIHIQEIKRCAEDLDYFRENYVKIRTKDGVNFPEMREYQKGFLDILKSDAESIVSLQPRQCCSGTTKINVDNKEITIKELFNECKKENNR